MKEFDGTNPIVRSLAASVFLVTLLVVAGISVGGNSEPIQGPIHTTEPNLHDADEVYGLLVSTIETPYLNPEDIFLLALGETDPNLYADVSFIAYGLYNDANSVNLLNAGAIDVNAVGGNAISSSAAEAFADTEASAIYGAGDVNNTGALTVVAAGGVADATDEASAYAESYGIYAEGDVNNTGAVSIMALAGTSDVNDGSYARAEAYASGIVSTGDVNNLGIVTATAHGGTASADGYADTDAHALGIASLGSMTNSGSVTVTSAGGVADANDEASANAQTYGLASFQDLTNTGDIAATAIGGTAVADDNVLASGDAVGIYTHGDVNNTGAIDARAVGGTAIARIGVADANAYGYGIKSHNGAIHNSGTIASTASAGTADANDSAYANGVAYGVYADGTVDNAGELSVTATAGEADANNLASAEVRAVGIYGPADIANSGDIHTIAKGGTVNGNALASAGGNAAGIYSLAEVTNSGDIATIILGGTATANTVAVADVNAAGIYGLTGVTNSGFVAAMALGGEADADDEADASAHAHGIHTDGIAINTGSILAAAIGGIASADDLAVADVNAVGIYGLAGATNSGAITVLAFGGEANGGTLATADVNAVGIYSLADVNNTGAITIMATGGTADANEEASAYADAYGILNEGNVNNSGSLTIRATGGTVDANGGTSADATAYISGIEADGDVNNTGDVLVQGTGGTANGANETFAEANVAGLDAGGALVNTGAITAIATGGTADANDGASAYAYAYGTYVDGFVSNTGAVTVTATGGTAEAGNDARADADALGIVSWEDAVTNAGNVTVVATGGTATGDTAHARAWARGIGADAAISNSGAISVTAAGGTATGSDDADASAWAYGLYSHAPDDTVSSVTNSGDITVIATAEEGSSSYAYGIYLSGNRMLTNTGTIRTSADTAYELYVASDATATLVDTYNVTLDGDPSDASIYVGDGATLALNDATLTVAYANRETMWETEYRLFEVDANGVVDGVFGDVQAVNPNTTAIYNDQNSADSADDTVSMAYTPVASSILGSTMVENQLVSQTNYVVNNHMTTTLLQGILSPVTSPQLADAGPVSSSIALAHSGSNPAPRVYVEPYYTRMGHDANPAGFDARLWGFAVGYERQMDNTLIGLHMGYGQADIDYTGAGYSANSEEQDVLTGGFVGLTRWDEWTLRYGLTGFYGSHDYQGLTGLTLDEREKSSTHSYGTVATVMGGYIIRRGHHVLLPEAGLNWLWAHRKRYTTEATDPAWDTTYSAMNDHDLQAEASVRWLSGFMFKDIHVTPSASIGIRHLLTDGESTVLQSVPGAAPVSVKSERDRTAMTLAGSVVLTKARHSLSVAYDGEYSPDTDRHSVWLRYGWQF